MQEDRITVEFVVRQSLRIEIDPADLPRFATGIARSKTAALQEPYSGTVLKWPLPAAADGDDSSIAQLLGEVISDCAVMQTSLEIITD